MSQLTNGISDGSGIKKLKPIRVQRKRTKGWKMPENTVYVGRPGRWGNPFIPDKAFHWRTHQWAVECYREHLGAASGYKIPGEEMVRKFLRGKNLACFCRLDVPCHADVLLEIANKD